MLNVPYLKQDKPGWCLPACIAMVAAYLEQPLLQKDIARWLQSDDLLGTPARRIQKMVQRGFEVTYTDLGTKHDLENSLARHLPPILFILTGELSSWSINTQHAVVLIGFEDESAYLLDPYIEVVPQKVANDELLLAWSHFDYTYATLAIPS